MLNIAQKLVDLDLSVRDAFDGIIYDLGESKSTCNREIEYIISKEFL